MVQILSGAMFYRCFPSGPFETNAYILFCPITKEAVFIDPAPGSCQKLIEFVAAHELTPKGIWLTHSHWDHIADVAALLKKFPIPVFVHTDDAENLIHPGSDQLPCWISFEGVKPTHLLHEGDSLSVGELQATVIETPGHTPGGVCFYLPKEKLLFSGDTLFQGSIGNLSFPTARPLLMWKSLSKLDKLPPDTLFLPGHGPSSTIGKETWLGKAEELFS